MSHWRKFNFNKDLTFTYNDLLNKFRIASSNVMLLYKENDRDYFASDFEKRFK